MKNYTSNMAPHRSIAAIEQMLVQAKAIHISKEYDASMKVAAIIFAIKIPPHVLPIWIRLPSNVKACATALKNYKQYRSWNDARRLEQAEKTAWRIIMDWVEIQLSMVEMAQAEMLEVFLPYVLTGRENDAGERISFYASSKEPMIKALTYSPSTEGAE